VSAPEATASVWPKGRLVEHPQPGKVWVQVSHLNDIGSDWIEADALPATPHADDASEPLTEAEREAVVAAITDWRDDWRTVDDDDVCTVVERIVAVREAAAATKARADERERIAQAIEAKYLGPDSGRSHDGREAPDAHCRNAYDEGLEAAVRIARGDA